MFVHDLQQLLTIIRITEIPAGGSVGREAVHTSCDCNGRKLRWRKYLYDLMPTLFCLRKHRPRLACRGFQLPGLPAGPLATARCFWPSMVASSPERCYCRTMLSCLMVTPLHASHPESVAGYRRYTVPYCNVSAQAVLRAQGIHLPQLG